LLDPGATFVDLGANLGYYTVLAGLRVGPRGRIFAFEPEADNFALLERNLADNGLSHCMANGMAGNHAIVRAERCAVAEKTGTARLHLSPDNQGDHRLYDSGDGRPALPTRTVSLDGYFGDQERFPAGPGALDLVKMDTQGCEARILRGAEALIAEQGAHLAWIVEFWPYGLARSGSSAAELLERLDAMNVNLAILREGEQRAEPTSAAALARLAEDGLHPDTGRFLNLVAIPRADDRRWARVLAVGGPA
jgi:FkbM family methyltransferase